MNAKQLRTILENHKQYLLDNNTGCRAYLSGADLRGAYGNNFATGSFGRHHAIAAGGYISIGCERHTYQEWLENGEKIGRKNNYTPEETSRYMAWIRLVVDWLCDNSGG